MLHKMLQTPGAQNKEKNVFIDSKGVHVIKIEKMVSKVDWYEPLKIIVKASDRYNLMKPDIWLWNIFFRKF